MSTPTAAPAMARAVPRGFTATLTAAMGASMLLLFVIGALAPLIVPDLGLSHAQLGWLVTTAYAVACASSLRAGRAVDIVGGRAALLTLLAVAALSLLLVSVAPTYGWLLGAVAVAGVAQALANPATNKLVAVHVDERRRSLVIGVKQSGVQLGSLLAGAALPLTAGAIGWRDTVRCTALVAVAALAAAWVTIPAAARRRQPDRKTHAAVAGTRWVRGLMLYSLLVGGAVAAVATYLPLYAHETLGLRVSAAGAVLVAFGASGLVSRIAWTQLAGRLADPARALAPLASAAAVFAMLTGQAGALGSSLLWLGAAGLGLTASAANAVSMLVVVQRSGAATAGHVSGLVSLAFFGGFVVSPPLFGVISDSTGYPDAWLLTAAQLAVAALVITVWRQRT